MTSHPHEHLDPSEPALPTKFVESDYGSDFDDDETAEVIALLEQLDAEKASIAPLVLESIENEVPPSFVRIPTSSPPAFQTQRDGDSVEQEYYLHRQKELETARFASTEVEYDFASRNSFFGVYIPSGLIGRNSIIHAALTDSQRLVPHEDSTNAVTFESTRPDEAQGLSTGTPLERFRTAPKKPLSVTDIVSPAWCELQYWYALTKYGRKKRTPAMKQGSAVHKVLEEQVHITIPVTVKKREDHWGLRMWNVITSLRTLQRTGLTRELEVWGVVDGQVVNGVIDELSSDCTDPKLENALSEAEKQNGANRELPADQPTISEYFASRNATAYGEAAWTASNAGSSSEKIYITDVKTRGAASIPKATTLKPTVMQLMLYRKLLSDLILGNVDSETVFHRYSLDSSVPFSDALIAQLSNLNATLQPSPSPGDEPHSPASPTSPEDTVSELLAHNSLAQLWRLMIAEYQRTMPRGDASLSNVLCAEFRSAHDGSVLGIRTFPYHASELLRYVTDEMQWWRGEREPRGVEIEDAFKCRMCEFADGCSWRAGKVEEAAERARLRAKARQRSVV